MGKFNISKIQDNILKKTQSINDKVKKMQEAQKVKDEEERKKSKEDWEKNKKIYIPLIIFGVIGFVALIVFTIIFSINQESDLANICQKSFETLEANEKCMGSDWDNKDWHYTLDDLKNECSKQEGIWEDNKCIAREVIAEREAKAEEEKRVEESRAEGERRKAEEQKKQQKESEQSQPTTNSSTTYPSGISSTDELEPGEVKSLCNRTIKNLGLSEIKSVTNGYPMGYPEEIFVLVGITQDGQQAQCQINWQTWTVKSIRLNGKLKYGN